MTTAELGDETGDRLYLNGKPAFSLEAESSNVVQYRSPRHVGPHSPHLPEPLVPLLQVQRVRPVPSPPRHTQ